MNNLALAGGNARPLDPEERRAILKRLETQTSMTWGGVRKALDTLFKKRGQSSKYLKFNLELPEGGSLLGNAVESKLAEVFGPEWDSRPDKQAIRNAVPAQLRDADYGELGQRVVVRSAAERMQRRRKAAADFKSKFNLSDAQADALASLTFAPGWDAYSSAALTLILPELEKGVRLGTILTGTTYDGTNYNDWLNENFPGRDGPTGEFLDLLPSPRVKEEELRLRELCNPTVVRVQNELRKVVNNLIRAYGKPDLVWIELTRDVGLSAKERAEKQSNMRKFEASRKRAAADLVSKGFPDPPSSADIEKWLLWKECGERDPYSGDHIGFDDLFRRGRFQVEHIWPRWRSLDDSQRNKTLCRQDLNLLKSDRTPYEAFGRDVDLWAAMCARLQDMTASRGRPGMSPGKVKRFLAKEMRDDFASRQLNDTGYAARSAVASLMRLWPDVGPERPTTVQAVSGKITGYLRRLWGLNNILADDGEKTRADHRHHAIDALVVACCDPGVTQRLSRYWQTKDDPSSGLREPRLDPPWPTIRQDAEQAITEVIISHRVRKKVSGALHAETVYGDTKIDEKTKSGTYRRLVTRKNVAALSKRELEQIPLTRNRNRRL